MVRLRREDEANRNTEKDYEGRCKKTKKTSPATI